MKIIVDFGEGRHVVIDVDRLVVGPDDYILVKQLDDGTPLVAGVGKQAAARYADACTEGGG